MPSGAPSSSGAAVSGHKGTRRAYVRRRRRRPRRGCPLRTQPGGPAPTRRRAGLVFPAAVYGWPPGSAARRAGRMRSAAPRRPAPPWRKGERRAGGEMDGAGREELGEACRAARRREQRRGSGTAARRGAERRGRERDERPASFHPPSLSAEWFGPRGMRCSAQRIEAGGMNHPTWGRGGLRPAGPPRQAAAAAAARASPPHRGQGGVWRGLSAWGRAGLREAERGAATAGLFLPPPPPHGGRAGRGLATAGRRAERRPRPRLAGSRRSGRQGRFSEGVSLTGLAPDFLRKSRSCMEV